MKNVANSSINNPGNSQSHAGAIPDPAEWVYEHHCLASFVHTLTHLKQILPDGCFFSDESDEAASEDELVIDAKARDILRANYSEDRWQYVENYLLVWDT
ncbi:MAG: hypothetical protein ACM37W_13200 [Actinomycetota bacterium]